MERRDFTINAIARRLETGEILDPLGGRADLERGCSAPPGRRAFATTRSGSSAASASSRSSTSIPMRTRCARCTSGHRGSTTSPGSGSAADWPRTGWASSRSSSSAHTRRRRCGWRVTPASSCTCCPSSGRRSATSSRAASSTCRSTSTSSRSSRPPPTPPRRSRCGSRRCCTTSASRSGPGRPPSRGDRRHHRRCGAAAAALSDEAARVRRQARAGASLPDPGRAHGRRRTPVSRAPRRPHGVRPARPPRRRPGGEDAVRGHGGANRPLSRAHRAGALATAPARGPGRGRHGSDRARLLRGAAARADAADAARRGRRGSTAQRARATARPCDGSWRDPVEPPGYSVVFSTRQGGVSEGPYASLNLGRMTGDDVECVDENRRLLCAAIDADAERLALNRQVHSTLVHRAGPGARGEPGDGLWTDDPEQPILAMTADCLPIALARAHGERAVAVLHAGWRGLLAGIVRVGAETLGGPLQAADRTGDRPVLLRGGGGGLGALRIGVRARRRPRPQARPLERRRARVERGRGRRRRSAPTSARSATPSASSRTAGPGSHGVSRE